ncbi:MAG TPA: hypothetical protein VFX12_15565 [Vicinamibacterales bacterium]|nr:hypothetical protein [Vicinamibacterales bacterium]
MAVLCATCLCRGAAAAQGPPDIHALVARVGARVANYYRRAQSLICTERSTVQPIEWNWSPAGQARTVESDLRLELDAADGGALPKARIVREIRRINGRAPRERDKKDRSGCTDPNPLSPEPLAFLLPPLRDAYRFTSVHEGNDRHRAAFIIDFETADERSEPELIGEAGGHDDCFDWTGPIASRGRVWVDAETLDVLKLERHIAGPTDVRVPWKLQREYGFDQWVVIDRDDLTLHYEPVVFTDPGEVILLPSSIDSLTVLRGGLQSIRRSDVYSGYRRFLTNGRVIKER